MDFFIGGIINFGGNFAPRTTAFCKGQLISISEYQATYAILGTFWGGDGRTTFALPDMQSRAPIGVGTGPGLATIVLGQRLGSETVTLSLQHLPTHNHSAAFTPTTSPAGELTATATVKANSSSGTESNASGQYWAATKSGLSPLSSYASTSDVTMADDAVTVDISGQAGGITGGSVTVGNTGNDQAFNIRQPSLGMEYIIFLTGQFPSRN